MSTGTDIILIDLVKSDKDTKYYVSKRIGKKISCTKTINSIDFDDISVDERTFYVDKLNALKKDLLELDESIHSYLDNSGACSVDEYIARNEEAEFYIDNINKYVCKLANISFGDDSTPLILSNDQNVNINQNLGHKVSLPRVDLPVFDGKPESYHKFITSFESLISNYNLSSFENLPT